jgi:outer membrane putative beta-barrel porin/alpha-amylase
VNGWCESHWGRPRASRLKLTFVAAGILPLVLVVGRLDAQEAQDPHAAQPERPTVATHAGTVAPGWLELETGIEADRFEDGSHAQTFPTFLKFGIVSHVQLGIGVPTVRPAGSSFGLGDVYASVKWRLLDHAPVVGDFAILSGLKLPTGAVSAGRGTGTTDLSVVAISSHSIGSVALDINLGYTRRSGDGTVAPKNASVWTVSTGGPAKGRLGFSGEIFGFPATSGPAGTDGIVALLGGPTLTLKAWLVLDGGVIIPLTGPQPKALYSGLTWNVGRLWQ